MLKTFRLSLAAGAFLLLTGCQSIGNFTQTVIDESKKTAHFTIELDEDTDYTMEQLIDEGRVDRVVFGGKLYELQGQTAPENKGDNLGFIGKNYYVDQHGNRWTDEELKKPYLYTDPKNIREKQPLVYGSVYRYKGQPKQSTSLLVIELNKKLYKATLVPGE